MTAITQVQYNALKAATLNNGELFVLVSGWWSAEDQVDGPWSSSAIRKLADQKLMVMLESAAYITDAGREVMSKYSQCVRIDFLTKTLLT